ncbi:putative glycosyltransferase EpsJ [Pseudooceanicola marinus]|uniref:Putative glycosyltransferase EpsJ n=1 Tax=Pseudooceanicola marinus TaxID=396013 RepID=A0A1X6Y7U6_9RHOB|nr:glycosyltransferase family A protein [Pseudooceanicola marinus]PJE33245.1 hypothetical protein CVM50_03105 [Pseudooceanicola marinus]SLN12813.1 putative glycosyltransferase EpsJ [Pseudooceanicola marinus]
MVTFSCITTCYNEGPLLRQSLQSMWRQDFRDFELILVMDGADAATRAEAERQNDPRLRLLRQANDGLSSARNRGLAAARGDYVCFLDADDTRPPWALQSLARAIDTSAPDLILAPGILSEETGQLSRFYDQATLEALGRQLASAPGGEGTPHYRRTQALALLAEPQSANKCLRRDLLQRAGLGFPNGHFFEDLYFHALSVAAAERLALCSQPTFTYHRRPGARQITGARDALRFDILAVIRLLLARFAPLPEARDPHCRAALLLSAAKLAAWCESMLSHHHRAVFRDGFAAVMALSDPAVRDLPDDLPPAFDAFAPARSWLQEVLGDPRLAAPPIREVSDAPDPIRFPRLWPKRRA